jgi:hypothetical protein
MPLCHRGNVFHIGSPYEASEMPLLLPQAEYRLPELGMKRCCYGLTFFSWRERCRASVFVNDRVYLRRIRS